jgi:hypothetical protein
MIFKRVKTKYFLIIGLIALVSFSFLLLNKEYELLEPSELIFIVGVIALCVSIISLGIADAVPKKMNLKVRAWSKHHDIQVSGRSRLVVKIFNQTKVSLKDLKVNVRVPTKIYIEMEETDAYLINSYGESKIFNFDYTYFLGSGNTDNIGTYEFTINHVDWNKGNIWFTITAEGFEASTYSISLNSKKQLLSSTLKNPLELKCHE